jgi:hypothetical protein
VNVRHLDEAGLRDGATAKLSHSFGVIARHPSLWWPATCAAARFAPRSWWRRAPFLPAPDHRYWRYRMETAYGDTDASPSDDDIAVAIRWSMRARARRR